MPHATQKPLPTLRVLCTIQDPMGLASEEKSSAIVFGEKNASIEWPVMRSSALFPGTDFLNIPVREGNELFVFVFTSARAVGFFFHLFSAELNLWAQIHFKNENRKKISVCLAGVGDETLRVAKSFFLKLFSDKSNSSNSSPQNVLTCLPPCSERGLEPTLLSLFSWLKTLEEADGSFQNIPQISIVTGAEGRTQKILAELPPTLEPKFKEMSGWVKPIEVYKMEGLPAPLPHSLETVLKNISEVEFVCRSGSTLRAAVASLCQFFQCKSPTDLPSQVFFVPWERSATAELVALGLASRMRQL